MPTASAPPIDQASLITYGTATTGFAQTTVQGAVDVLYQRQIAEDYTQIPRWHIKPPEYDFVTPISQFEEDETWSATMGTATTEPLIGVGKQSRFLTSDGGTAVQADRSAATPIDASVTPVFETIYRIDDKSQMSAISFIFGVAGGFSKYASIGISTTTRTPAVNGWNVMRAKLSDFTHTGGFVTADWANVNIQRIITDAAGSGTITAHFASTCACKPRPMVFLDHDDGHATTTGFWTIEEKYGLRSTNYIISGFVGNTNYVTWSQLFSAYKNGHDISNHTDDDQLLSDYVSDALRRVAVRNGYFALLHRRFRRSARFFASPGGQTKTQVANLTSIVSEFAVCNRGGGALGLTYAYPVTDPYNTLGHSSVSTTDTPDVATVKAWVDTCIAEGTSLHIVAHQLDVGTAPGLSVSTAWYTELCRYLREKIDAGLLLVPTMSEYWDQSAPLLYTNALGLQHQLTVATDNTATVTRTL